LLEIPKFPVYWNYPEKPGLRKGNKMSDKYEVEFEGQKFYVYDDADGASIAPVEENGVGSMALGQIFDSLSEFHISTVAIQILKGRRVEA